MSSASDETQDHAAAANERPSSSDQGRSSDDAAFLRSYDADRYALPSVTVDVVALTVLDNDLKVLVVKRETPPFEGQWSLPGSFVRVAPPASHPSAATFTGVDEELEDAALRTLRTKAQMPAGTAALHQLMTVGPLERDPRTRVVTVVFLALVAPELSAFWRTAELSAPLQWRSFTQLAPLASAKTSATHDDTPPSVVSLAFDHAEIAHKARARLIRDLGRTHPAMAFELVGQTFTIGELRALFEAVEGSRIDPGNFRRRFLAWEAQGLVRAAPGTRVTGRRRAQVYEKGV